MAVTQRDKVLALLRDAGGRGIHTFELRQAFIGNPSQRIAELEAAGFEIEHTREKLHGQAQGTRYTLKSAGVGRGEVGPLASPAPPPADSEGGQLVGFDAAIEVGGAESRPMGPYDVFEDAA